MERNLNKNKSIRVVEAFLWDGKQQLEGKLFLTAEALFFRQKGFSKSHLKCEIELKDIEELNTFLVYNIVRNGIRIKTKSGNEDCFVTTESEEFIRAIRLARNQIK